MSLIFTMPLLSFNYYCCPISSTLTSLGPSVPFLGLPRVPAEFRPPLPPTMTNRGQCVCPARPGTRVTLQPAQSLSKTEPKEVVFPGGSSQAQQEGPKPKGRKSASECCHRTSFKLVQRVPFWMRPCDLRSETPSPPHGSGPLVPKSLPLAGSQSHTTRP